MAGKAPVSRRGASLVIEEARDASRSVAEWRKLDKSTIVLKCNSYNIDSSGIKDVLIKRLVRKFRSRDRPSGDENSHESDDNDENHDDVDDLDLGLAANPDQPGTPTDPYGETSDSSNPNTSASDRKSENAEDQLSLGEYSDFDSARSDATDTPHSPRRK